MTKKIKVVFIIILSSLLSACFGGIYTTHIDDPFYQNSDPFGEWREGKLRVVTTKSELEVYLGKPDLKEVNGNKWTYIQKDASQNSVFVAFLILLPPISWHVDRRTVFYFQEEKIFRYNYENSSEKKHGGMCGFSISFSGSPKLCWQ